MKTVTIRITDGLAKPSQSINSAGEVVLSERPRIPGYEDKVASLIVRRLHEGNEVITTAVGVRAKSHLLAIQCFVQNKLALSNETCETKYYLRKEDIKDSSGNVQHRSLVEVRFVLK